MGGRGSSSKRKSSKRKRDKISSKKKSRRKEPKKRRRIYESVTSDSDGDSLNSEHSSSSTSKSDQRRRINKNTKRHRDSSLSSYSDYESVSSDSDSDNACKSRKARRSRVGLKDTKRRGRKRFTSPNSDVDAHSVQKRKRLGRDRVVKPIKKSSKKKSRKYSSSSSSSDSESQSRSSSSTADGKRQRSKVIPNQEIERLKGRDSHKGKKKRKVRTPSCSSCDRGSDPRVSASNSDGALFPISNSRRLRSVIAVVDQPHDEGENRWEMDLHKEEIVYDQNDYPSPKSFDSNEGGGRMDSGNHSHGAFSNRMCVENVAGEEVPELGKSRIDEGVHQLEGAHTKDSEEEKEIDVSVPRGDLLESILRQKALENLRKFQGRRQTGPRSTVVEINNESDVGTVGIVQNESINQGTSIAEEMDQRKGLPSKGDFSLMEKVKKLPDNEHVEKDPEMAKQSFAHPPNVAALLECSEEDKGESSRAVSSTVETSSVRPISGEHGLELGNEAKDGSQFEQKTMSVMRGGEVVQVSYKVYIPKKAPALARRQLGR